jgi:arylsulfatase
LLDLAGVPVPADTHIDGISIAPTLLGRSQPERAFLYREFHGYGGQHSIRVGNWKLLQRNLLPTPKNRTPSPLELYDLASDPEEKTNAAAANPEVVKKLESLMRSQHSPSKEFPIPVLDIK